MNQEEFARRVEQIRSKLYRTAMLYLPSEAMAVDAVDEAVYKALCSLWRLREPKYFDTWITRILINECHNELRRTKRFVPLDSLPELPQEELDSLPLRQALDRLPGELKDVVILRFFAGFTLSQTAQALQLPQGTVVTRQRKALKLLKLDLEEVPL